MSKRMPLIRARLYLAYLDLVLMHLKVVNRFLLARLKAISVIHRTTARLAAEGWAMYAYLYGIPATEEALCRAGAQMLEQDRHHVVYRVRVTNHAVVTLNIHLD